MKAYRLLDTLIEDIEFSSASEDNKEASIDTVEEIRNIIINL